MSVDARPVSRSAPGRALLVVAAVSTLTAIVLFVLATRSSADVALDVDPVTADRSPVTIAPIDDDQGTEEPPAEPVGGSDADASEPAAGDGAAGGVAESADNAGSTDGDPDPAVVDGESASDGSAEAGATTPEPAPLADLLGERGSAIPPAIEPRVRPQSVSIDDIDLWGPVRAVGLADDGQLEVPDETEIGWYRYGSSPGRAGATVLAAHVSWNRTIGPFHQLGRLEPGARVDVRLDDDSLRTYEVVERAIYDKDSLPRNRIWRTTGDETLVLITCGGSFNPDINRYRQNIVVYAVPVSAADVAT